MAARHRARLGATVAALVLVAAIGGTACAPAAPPPIDPVPTARDLPVAVAERDFVDGSRSTPAYEDFPGADDRTLPTTIWYPADRTGPYPLVVFAHGFGVDPWFAGALLERIAASGYVVAAPTLPLLSGWPAGPTDSVDWEEKYTDLQFVTSSVLDLSASGDPDLGGQVDGSRIAVMGHSDGALLAFGDGFEAGRTDDRVRAVVALAAGLGGSGEYESNGHALLHMVSEFDEYNDFGAAVAWDHAVLGDPSWTVAVWGGRHAPPYTDPDDPRFDDVVATIVDFLDFQLKAQSDAPFLGDVDGSPNLGFV